MSKLPSSFLFGRYLAVVLSLILQHLLQVEAAGQVALGQVVAKLGDAQQALLRRHRVAVHGTTWKSIQRARMKYLRGRS